MSKQAQSVKTKATASKKANTVKTANSNGDKMAAKAKTADFQSIPLNLLTLSDNNVRKSAPSEADEKELKNSIVQNGLKQNLIVHTDGKDGYLVDAGGRRLKALQELADEKAIPVDFPVRCLIEEAEDATITSTVENTHRTAMHAADQFEAFKNLIEENRTEEEIATKFGVSVDIVQKRLKLASVAPEILEAFRKDEMHLEKVMAFAITDDHERQLNVWNNTQNGHVHPNHIKSMLTKDKYAASSKLAKFVGIEVYSQAGGTLTTDLFSDHNSTFLDDTALLERLASEKLNEVAAKYIGDWNWVDALVDTDFNTFRSFGRIYPENSEPNPELADKIDQLRSREDDLFELQQDRDLTKEESEEYNRIDDQVNAIEAQIKDEELYDEDNMKFAGVIVSLNFDGTVIVQKGLVRPEDIASLKADKSDDEGTEPNISNPTTTTAPPASESAAIARRSEGITAGLANDLRSTRHHILRAHIAGDFEVAFDAMLYTICSQALRHKYLSDMPCETTLNSYYDPNQKKLVKDSIAEKMLDAMKADLRLEWMRHKQPEDFKALCQLPTEDKQALFAWATAYSVRAQLSTDDHANPIIENIGSRMEVNVEECWRPTAQNYWGTVTKAHIGKVAKDLISDDFAQERLSEKKGEAAAAMETVFSELAETTSGLEKSVTIKTTSWLPKGMAFGPSGQVDDVTIKPETAADEVNAADLPAFLTEDKEADAA